MGRHSVFLWRFANYPVGAFGVFHILSAAGDGTSYDEFGNEYNASSGYGTYIRFGFGLCVVAIAMRSAAKNKEFRDSSSN